MNKVFALGEVIIDIVKNKDAQKAYLGGAPVNFLSIIARSNIPSYIITSFGDDNYSVAAYESLRKMKINTEMIYYYQKGVLPYSETFIDENGERSFKFHFKDAAFTYLNYFLIDFNLMDKDDVFYLSSVANYDENILHLQQSICHTMSGGLIIYFDVNLRPSLFKKGVQESIAKMFLAYVDILKVSIDELYILCKNNDESSCIDYILKTWRNICYVIVSKGKDGVSLYKFDGTRYDHKGIKPHHFVNTLGAGDVSGAAFIATLIKSNKLTKTNLWRMDDKTLKEAIKNFTKAGSKVCEYGGGCALFSLDDLNKINS